VAVGGGFLWVIPGPIATGKAAARVSLVSTRTHRLAASVPLKGETTTIAYGDGAAWIGIYDPGSGSSWVAVLRPGAAKPRYVRVGSGDGWGPLAIGIGGTGVWVLTSEGALIELGTELRPVRTFRLAAYEPRDVAASPSAVWVLNGSRSRSSTRARATGSRGSVSAAIHASSVGSPRRAKRCGRRSANRRAAERFGVRPRACTRRRSPS
jgi:hypothetical protein